MMVAQPNQPRDHRMTSVAMVLATVLALCLVGTESMELSLVAHADSSTYLLGHAKDATDDTDAEAIEASPAAQCHKHFRGRICSLNLKHSALVYFHTLIRAPPVTNRTA